MKQILVTIIMGIIWNNTIGQGCSDAGICTIGNFNASHSLVLPKQKINNEIDLAFNYGAHGKDERFYQFQANYRLFKNNGSFYEFRLPINTTKNTTSGTTLTGIGDIVATYNNKFSVTKTDNVDYSLGLRISLSNADKADGKTMHSYIMPLQTGLGTTDLVAAASYDIFRYLSVGTGIQVPLFQYNKNNIPLYTLGTAVISGEGYRRKPDALLKFTGHYTAGKVKLNGGLLGIFHLADDYYNTIYGKYSLINSKGVTINWNIDISYHLAKKYIIGFLYAEPITTRTNIPDGLARSRVLNIKLTHAF